MSPGGAPWPIFDVFAFTRFFACYCATVLLCYPISQPRHVPCRVSLFRVLFAFQCSVPIRSMLRVNTLISGRVVFHIYLRFPCSPVFQLLRCKCFRVCSCRSINVCFPCRAVFRNSKANHFRVVPCFDKTIAFRVVSCFIQMVSVFQDEFRVSVHSSIY